MHLISTSPRRGTVSSSIAQRLSTISTVAVAVALLAGAQAATAAEAAADASDAAAIKAAEADASQIIVTGTRSSGITAAQSVSPITVLGDADIARVGQPNLNQVLTQLVPSFTAEAFGGDTANLTLSARLRGLSPNHTLVLLNGKRRHSTANLHVLGGAYQGGAAPDLSLIPTASVKRIEVLQDGAAAQYGSDAIAGIINIIMKDTDSGGSLQLTGGQYYQGDGGTWSANTNLGLSFGETGFLNLTLAYTSHDFSANGGPDARLSNPDGSIKASLSPALQAAYLAIPGYPYVNHIIGDAKSQLATLAYNTGYDFGTVQLYSFGTLNRRTAKAYENFRVPDRVRASPVLGVRGNFTDPGELIFAPQGFNPQEGLVETDGAATGGIKGEVSGWAWDLSTTYGSDTNSIYTYNSANAALYVDTHFTPTSFYDGEFKSTEWTSNLDISKAFDVGMGGPMNVAFGAEFRKNTYSIKQGDPGSIYKEGGQSYPGFQPTDAASHSRNNTALYIDIGLMPVENLRIDGALRLENYTDFGSKLIGKLSGRYDFTPAFALRGTISNGFRAPTEAEEFYSATNVSPTSAVVQLPANSDAAKLLGFNNLEPETSTNLSFGMVAKPADRLTLTIDAYQININNRIIATGTIFGSGGALNSPAVLAAIAAHGNVLDPTVTFTGVSVFTNGVDTQTRGIDIVLSYLSDFDKWGVVNWGLAGNWNQTKLRNVIATPAPVAPQPLFDQTALSTLETGSPRYKLIASAAWTVEKFSLSLRETLFGTSTVYYSPNGGIYTKNTISTAAITDLEVSYQVAAPLQLTIGANNLFNKRPNTVVILPGNVNSNGGNVFYAPLTFSPYGINGGYYYARATVTF